MTVFVIGVGNEFRRDDAAGLLAARRLGARNFPGVTVVELGGEGADLMAAWEGEENVYLIDAVQSGAEAGTIQRFEAHQQELPADSFSYSSHAFGVAEAIELARSLGQLPSKVVVYGIEGDRFEAGRALSPVVEEAIGVVVDTLVEEFGWVEGLVTNWDHE